VSRKPRSPRLVFPYGPIRTRHETPEQVEDRQTLCAEIGNVASGLGGIAAAAPDTPFLREKAAQARIELAQAILANLAADLQRDRPES